MRVIKPSLASVGAVSSVYSLASATRYLGVGALAKAAIRASARSLKIGVSDVLPSQLLLTRGTPPSWDTRSSKTTCFKSGR